MTTAQETALNRPGPRENPRESLAFGQFQVFWGDTLRITDDGFELDIRIPWYRSLPLSSVQTLEVTVDGQRIAPEAVRFQLYGERLALDELPNLFTTWWFILDPATLHVAYDRPLQAGEKHTVELGLGFKIPYMMIGPNAFVQLNQVKKTLTAVEEAAA
ncbi:MAG: hypothetical protein JOZ41_08110 [Chloroflexi bacterium]|nr:hypothetical protein [Chloroflexota bacterium]